MAEHFFQPRQSGGGQTEQLVFDAVEMLAAGATVVGVGTAIHTRGVDALAKINAELAEFMAQNNFGSIAALRGRAL